jgi:hypothetical protein
MGKDSKQRATARARLAFVSWAMDSWRLALEGDDEDGAARVEELVERVWLAMHRGQEPRAIRQRILVQMVVRLRREVREARREGTTLTDQDVVDDMRTATEIVDPGSLVGVGDEIIARAVRGEPTTMEAIENLLQAAGVQASASLVDKYLRGVDRPED